VPNDTRPTQSLDHCEEYFPTEEASSGVKGLRTMKRIRIRVRPKVRWERAWVVEVMPLDPRDELVRRAKQLGRSKKAA